MDDTFVEAQRKAREEGATAVRIEAEANKEAALAEAKAIGNNNKTQQSIQ